MNYEFNILYYINMYKKWWKNIAFVMFISMLLTMCFSFFQPVIYVSAVRLITSGGGESSGYLGKFLSGLSEGSLHRDTIVSILESRHMAKDINKQFSLGKKPKFRYSIHIRRVTGGNTVEIRGTDPALTEKIANFAIQNLDKINAELDITPNKPMVKVLDLATYGVRQSRQVPKKMFLTCLFSFLLVSLYAFFSDYLRRLKSQ